MKALNPENTLKPAAGQLTYQRDGFPAGRTARVPAGRQKLQRDGDFLQRDSENFSRTAIFSGGEAKTSARQVAAGVCRIDTINFKLQQNFLYKPGVRQIPHWRKMQKISFNIPVRCTCLPLSVLKLLQILPRPCRFRSNWLH
jgi:hypothetical protein